MAIRIISAIIGLLLLALVMFSGEAVFVGAVSVLSFVAVYEILKTYGHEKNKLFLTMGLLTSIVFAIRLYFIPYKYVLLFVLLVIVSYVFYMLLNHENFSSKDLFTMLSSTLAIPFVFSTLGYIRIGDNGEFLVWMPLLSAWLTDTFAYFGGFFFGKHKLCPKISPKKTVEGAISGTIGAVAGYIVYAILLKNIWGYDVFILNFAIIAFVTSILSQMGDLLASSVKRENNIKDFGNIMPGHGGVLDRFDSLLFTSPCIFICLKIFTLIG